MVVARTRRRWCIAFVRLERLLAHSLASAVRFVRPYNVIDLKFPSLSCLPPQTQCLYRGLHVQCCPGQCSTQRRQIQNLQTLLVVFIILSSGKTLSLTLTYNYGRSFLAGAQGDCHYNRCAFRNYLSILRVATPEVRTRIVE